MQRVMRTQGCAGTAPEHPGSRESWSQTGTTVLVCQPRSLPAGKQQDFTLIRSMFCDSTANSQRFSVLGARYY